MRAVKNSPAAPLEKCQFKLFSDARSKGRTGHLPVGIPSTLGEEESRKRKEGVPHPQWAE